MTSTDTTWTPEYSPWRHGGWYVDNIRYPSGAVGCVSRNYPDRKWRIACDERPGAYELYTYPNRDAAARAEKDIADAETAARVAEVAPQLARFDQYPPEPNGRKGHCLFCGGFVPVAYGLICLGHDGNGTFAAPLHKYCADLVDAEHKRT